MPKGKGNLLSRKYGPLPGWGWGAVLIGGLVMGIYLRRRFAASGSSGGQAVPSADAGTSAVPTSGSGGGVSTGDTGLNSDLVNALVNSVNTLGGVVSQDQANFVALQTQTFSFEKSILASISDLVKSAGDHNSGGGSSGTGIEVVGNPPPSTPVQTPGPKPIAKAPVSAVTKLESKAAQNALKGPTSVKAKPNPTGVSANKGQGVISIH